MLATLLATLLSGPVIGLIGKFLTSWMGQKDARISLDELRLKQDHELKLHQLNQKDAQEERASTEYVAEITLAADTLKASYKHDSEYGTLPSKWVPWFRAIRPGLTIALFISLMIIFFTIGVDQYNINGMTIKEKIVMSIVTMFEIALTWWFADRQSSNRGAKT